MSLLLDTHALLWWLHDPVLLTREAHDVIAEGRRPVFVSAAATWEITVKKALGKLEAPDDLEEVMAEEGFLALPISIPHTLAVATLPAIHQDPFDRIQIAQAKLEGLTLVTRDQTIKEYGVPVIEA